MTWIHHTTIEVIGTPKAQPRTSPTTRNGKPDVYTPDRANGWKNLIAMEANKHLPVKPLEGPIKIDCLFLMPRPRRLMRLQAPGGHIPHTSKPDRDNLDKAVLDCLTQIGFIKDDRQVCEGEILKYYHEKGGQPGVVIKIYQLEEM